MLSSSVAAAADHPPAKGPSFDSEPEVGDDDDYEIVYEEVEEEIEVEEEVEEEIEGEEEEDDDAIGEALTPVNQMDYQNDTSRAIEPHSPEEHIRSGSATPGKSVADLPSAGCVIEGYSGICGIACLNTKRQEEESIVNGEGIAKNHDGGASQCDKWGRYIENNSLSSGEIDAPASNVDTSSSTGTGALYCEKETDQTAGEDSKQVFARVPRVSPRSLSPSTAYSDGSKRQAIVCDFFSKGWCIKGSSCKFIHKRDHVAISSRYNEGNVDAAEKKTEPLDDGALSISLIPLERDGKIPGEKSEMKLPSQKDDPLVVSSFNFGRESLRRGLSWGDYCHYSSPMAKGNSFHRMFSSSSITASENYRSTRISPHVTSLNIVPSRTSQFVPNDHNSSIPNSSLYKPPLSSSYFSWNPDPVDPQKQLDSSQDYGASKLASLKQGSSPFSGPDSEYLSQSNVLNDMQHLVGPKRKISFDWEPSAPFRPSFFITQRLLSRGSLYDPTRDSIEQTSSGDGPPRSFYSGVGTSIIGAQLHSNDDLIPKGTLGSECSFSKYSNSDHSFHANDSSKTFPGKDLRRIDTDTTDSLGGQGKNRSTSLKDEKLNNSNHVRDVKKASEKLMDHDSGSQSDGSRQKTEVKEERVGQNTEADLDLKVDGCIQKDSRTLKYFHAALVEFVKELLKPTWHKGVLSKDAHKMIVRKAVDKVIGTLQHHQIPSTSESVKQYLSFSEAKLAKLIEGYVDKYRKS